MIDRAFTVPLPRDAMQAAALFSVDPSGVGGVVLRGCGGPQRDAWLQQLTALLPEATTLRNLPLNIDDDRLLGGLDLAATLVHGKPVARAGLLAEADGGVVLINSADRLADRCAAHLAAVLDTQEVIAERQGVATRRPSRIGVVAFDTGVADDERPPAGLLDRLSFWLDLEDRGSGEVAAGGTEWCRADVVAARTLLPAVRMGELGQALCEAAVALGIDSMRAPLLAWRVARTSAALDGRTDVSQADAALAARLVLGPRATVIPSDSAPAEAPNDAPAQPDSQDDPPATTKDGPDLRADPASTQADDESQTSAPPRSDTDPTSLTDQAGSADVLLEAAAARLPRGLLDAMKAGREPPARSQRTGSAGAAIEGALRGRPDGVRAGRPRGGSRLNLIETLRAAAPWQTIRRGNALVGVAGAATGAITPLVQVRREDFRVTRFKQRSETTTLFAVDASGSSALHRLAEAKGAVELLLADCYVRRDSVSLISFRGTGAEVLLPPTRSLVRAKRSLAGLVGGGGTPLAAAIDATVALAETTRRHGRTPVAVLLTDGCANVARDGAGGRARAVADAHHAARLLRARGIKALVLDMSPQPQQPARDLAVQMGAMYLPLPHADAASLSRAMRAASDLAADGPRGVRA